MTSGEVTWRLAVHPTDQPALSTFNCARPAPPKAPSNGWKKIYPQPAEAYAQRSVRELRTAKDNRGKRGIWIGEDDKGIAAVLAWEWQDKPHVHLNVAAIASRCRGEPTRQLSTDMIDTVLQQLAGQADADGFDHLIVTAYIHQDNAASEAFAERQGMGCLDKRDSRDGGYRLWSLEISW